MGLAQLAVYDPRGGVPRRAAPGDVLLQGEMITTINSTSGVTLTANQLISGIINRTGTNAGAFNDTTPTAQSIIDALVANQILGSAVTNFTGNPGQLGAQQGTTFRLNYINNGTTQTATIVGGTNVTVSGTATVANNTIREFLASIDNGTVQQVFQAATTNASTTVTGLILGQTNLITPGMAVSGTGIQAGTVVTAVNPGVGVTLSLAATATGTASLTFSPRITLTNLGSRSL